MLQTLFCSFTAAVLQTPDAPLQPSPPKAHTQEGAPKMTAKVILAPFLKILASAGRPVRKLRLL